MKTVEMLSYEDSRDAFLWRQWRCFRSTKPMLWGRLPVTARVLYLPVGYVNSVPTAEKVPPPCLIHLLHNSCSLTLFSTLGSSLEKKNTFLVIVQIDWMEAFPCQENVSFILSLLINSVSCATDLHGTTNLLAELLCWGLWRYFYNSGTDPASHQFHCPSQDII